MLVNHSSVQCAVIQMIAIEMYRFGVQPNLVTGFLRHSSVGNERPRIPTPYTRQTFETQTLFDPITNKPVPPVYLNSGLLASWLKYTTDTVSWIAWKSLLTSAILCKSNAIPFLS
jgi:hypothetical protein